VWVQIPPPALDLRRIVDNLRDANREPVIAISLVNICINHPLPGKTRVRGRIEPGFAIVRSSVIPAARIVSVCNWAYHVDEYMYITKVHRNRLGRSAELTQLPAGFEVLPLLSTRVPRRP
jgi:hypothetical protein